MLPGCDGIGILNDGRPARTFQQPVTIDNHAVTLRIHLNDLTDTLLLLARAESGRLPLQRETFSLEDLVREVCERLEVLATEKNQRIEISTAPEISIQADRILLRQAIT